MARGYLPLLLTVAAIWGASYMFIEIALDEIEPAPMMALRLLLAGLVLVPLLLVQHGGAGTLRDLRAAGLGILVLAFANNALPFTLIAWGQKHIDSSIAAIANAPVPLFVALLALKFNPSERVTGLRLVGVALGFLGVGVLAGFNPEGGWLAVAGTLAVVGATISYAASNLFAQSRFSETQPLLLVAASSLAAAVMLAPLAVIQRPDAMPGWESLASVAALGVGGTAIALILYYRMLASYGASRSSLVTYLLPPIAVVYGVLLLDEALTANAIAGTLAVVAAAVCYAVSNIFAASRFSEVSPFVVVTGSSVTGALMLTPLALFQLPTEMPSAQAVSSVVALGVLGTAVALLFFYRMLNRYGASRAALVTYLIPLVAMVYGVGILDEPISANAVAGLVLILGGVAIGSGVVRFARREVVPAAPRS